MVRLALLYIREGKIKANYMPKFIINSGIPGYGYRPVGGIVSIPSIQLVGEDDYFICDNKNWTAHYKDPSLLIHSGGHLPPRELNPACIAHVRSFLKRFLLRPSL